MSDEKISELCEKLNEYAELDGHNRADACRFLTHLADYRGYLTDEFYSFLIKEIKSQLEFYDENTTIVHYQEPISRIENKVRLDWKKK